MKKTIYLLAGICLSSFAVKSQVSETFADGNTTVNPTWVGDNSKFEIDVNGKLHLNDVGATGLAQLTTTSSSINNASWELDAHLDFDPSGSNYARVYLVSNSADLTVPLNGYFIQIGGETGSLDSYDLFKQAGNTLTKIIDGTDGLAGVNPNSKVKVTRDSVGNWTLYVDTTRTGSNYLSQGSVNNNDFKLNSNFGFYLKYSSTRKDKFYFDNIVITGNGANQAPVSKDVTLSIDKTNSIQFNLNTITADPENNAITYSLVSNPTLGTALISGKNVLYNPFSNSNGTDVFSFKACDVYGDCDTATITVIYNPNNVSAILFDAFTDNNFTSSPTWIGNTTKFEVDMNKQLHLKDSVTGAAYLASSSKVLNNAVWEFDVKLDFDPSTTNYARVYLAASASDLSANLNGYYVQVGGESGNIDSYDLFKQEGATKTKIIDGIEGLASIAPNAKVRVTRTGTGDWTLAVDTTITAKAYVVQGTVTDNTVTTSSFMGVYCKYSSTRADKMYFDNFKITGTAGNSAPIAVADKYYILEGASPYSYTVLANDSDPESNPLTITKITVSPKKGTASVNTSSNPHTITYGTADHNYNGKDSLTYEVCDNGTPALCATAKVVFTIAALNDAPTVIDEIDTIKSTEKSTVNLLANDSDIDGDVLTLSIIQSPSKGSFIMSGSVITYTPNMGTSGLDKITYLVCDNGAPSLCDTGEFKIYVEAPTGNNELEADLQLYFSNPFTENLVVSFKSTIGINTEIRLLNAKGEVLESKISNLGMVEFNTNQYTAGTYYIQLASNGVVSTKRAVKIK